MEIEVNMRSIKNAREEQVLVAKNGTWYAVSKKEFLAEELKDYEQREKKHVEFESFTSIRLKKLELQLAYDHGEINKEEFDKEIALL